MAWCKRFMPIVVLIIVSLFIGGITIYAAGSDPSTWPIVYQDDFENPSSGWDVGKSADVTMAYVDGAYEIQVQTSNTIAWSYVPTNKDYLDFSAQVEARSLGNDGEFGVLFRYVDSDSFYCFTIRTDGSYRLQMQKAGAWQTLIDWTSIPGVDSSKVHTINVEAQGDRFTFSLDGRTLTQFSDKTFRGGRIALVGGTFDEPFGARFDNLMIREDPEIRKLAEQGEKLSRQADAAYSAWQLDDAKEKYAQAADIYHKLNWKSKQANAELSLGNSFYLLSGYQDAIKHYGDALSVYREIGDRRGEARSLNNLGLCYDDLGDYKQAIDYYEKSLAIERKIGDQRDEAASLNNLGICYEDLGDYQHAIDYYEKSLAIERKIGDQRDEAYSLNNLGICYYALGDYKQAIDYYEQSLSIDRAIGDQRGEASSLIGLGSCYYALGDYKQAIDYYEQALAIFQKIGDQRGEAQDLNNLGVCYENLGDYQQAIDYYEQALAIEREIGGRRGEANSLDNLGNCYEALGDYKQAIDYHEQSLAIKRAIGNRRGEAASLDNLGNCYEALGDYKQAIDYYQSCLAVIKGIASAGYASGASEALWRVYNGLGSSYRALSNPMQAAEAWKQAVEVIEGMRGELERARFKSSFMKGKLFVYGKLVPTLVEMGSSKDAVSYAERAKARTLEDMVETAMREGAPLPGALQAASESFKELVSTQQAAAGPLSRAARERTGLQRATQMAEKDYEAILDKLERTYPELGETLSVNPDKLQQHFQYVQGKLGQGTIALEYFVTDDETIAWVITHDGIQTASRILISRNALTAKVRSFRERIQEPPKQVVDLETLKKARDLYDILISPIEDYIQTASRLVIVPSDVLFYLPFGALYRCPGCEGEDLFGGKFLNQEPCGKTTGYEKRKSINRVSNVRLAASFCLSGKILLSSLHPALRDRMPLSWPCSKTTGNHQVENYSISYAPSLSSLYWPFHHAKEGSYNSILAVGNPTGNLPASEKEVEKAAALFPQSTVLIGAQATEAAVKSALHTASYDVVHLSTHGLFDTKMPLLSELVFREGGNDDGNLYAGEILGLPLTTNLVVLSACQTALPPELTQKTEGLVVGDELQGLSQALFVAGAPSAALTLWNVDDVSTSQLMQAMYQRLQKGAEKGEALEQAQLALIHDPSNLTYHHPYYWAPFVLYGDWR